MQSVNIHCLIVIHLFDQKYVFGEPQCGGGARAVAEEEAGIEVAAKETGLSGVNSDGGNWQSREWWSRDQR
jgi:hypothetical protein